jgi:hypothetical protein
MDIQLLFLFCFLIWRWQLWRRLTEEVFAPSLAQARAATPLSEASKQNLSKVTTGTIAAFALIVPAIHDLAAQSASS